MGDEGRDDGAEGRRLRIRFRARGRVQGVSFRAATAAEARRLGVAGWVRNRADGTVEGEAEGPAAAVRALAAWLERGPPAARVDALEVEAMVATREEEGSTAGALAPFQVRRDG